MDPKLLRELVDRCEREKPSRELDAEIHCAITGRVTHKDLPAGYTMMAEGGHRLARTPYIFKSRGPAPHYSTSIDAAEALVPENYFWMIECRTKTSARAEVFAGGNGAGGGASSSALALCAAALKARAAIAEQAEASTNVSNGGNE